MSLKRKVTGHADSMRVVIPHQLAEMHDIKSGDILEFQPETKGVFKIIAHSKMCQVRRKGSNEVINIYPVNGKCIPPKGFELIK